MIRVVDQQMIRNCPADRSSIKDAISIFGTSVPNLQGKTTRSTQGHVILDIITPISPTILTRHKNVVLGMDVVKINKVRFLLHMHAQLSFAQLYN